MRIVLLSQVAEVAAGQGAPQSPSLFSSTGKPFVRAGSLDFLLRDGREDHLEQIGDSTARQLKLRLFPPNTILFAKSGMSATLGRIYKLRSPCYVVNHLAAIIPGEHLDSSYLAHWFRVNPPSRLIPNESYPSIRLSDISRIKLNLPPLPEQKRIAAILDKADEIRRKREKAIKLTDAFLRSVFLEMFGDPVSNPRKWGTVAIREIAKVVTGNTPSRKISSYYGDEIDWIKSDNINTPSHFLTPASERLSLSGKAVGRVVPRNSILITCIAGSPACIGNAAISTREVAFNQQINALVPFSDNCEFIYSLILLGKQLIQSASTNSMKGMVSKGKLEQIKVINPPDSLQQRFREVFLAHCKHRETLECQLLRIMECQNSLVAHLLYPNNEGLAQRGTASTYETAHAL
jgi:type I restriction enzyme S subunit